ncbi:cytochrome c [Puniceibacterium sp. IMCC21224]|uniref:c-type cytochrome n=1 Tax=Puniceibacterium sp. IMCC21224 TaxID=1618204 RepID=UPI00064DCA2F|nr:cytochrome c [Puniceibacterium sp. IMCC21224]KMK66950.1 cytochrome c556 [Puniceibacterium sp. IMCC21224]
MKKRLIALVVASLAFGTTASAQDDFSGALKARKGQFNILAINLGILGGMAKGETPYDAEAAQTAADTLVAVSMINQPPLFPAGSDNMSIEDTRAQPSVWDNREDFLAKWAGLGEAALKIQAAAGTGQEALGPMLGMLGGACKACHDNHRAPAG